MKTLHSIKGKLPNFQVWQLEVVKGLQHHYPYFVFKAEPDDPGRFQYKSIKGDSPDTWEPFYVNTLSNTTEYWRAIGEKHPTTEIQWREL